LCGTRDGNRWRNEMSSLVEAEQAPPERRDRMIASFNRSYTAYEQTYRSCTPAAEVAISRYISEGARLSRDIATRYGNSAGLSAGTLTFLKGGTRRCRTCTLSFTFRSPLPWRGGPFFVRAFPFPPMLSNDNAGGTEDERRAALAYLSDAWEEARLDGIDGDCLAQVALFAALHELVSTYGEDATARFAEGLSERIRHGEFSLPPRRQ
jgi:hypothetical protein